MKILGRFSVLSFIAVSVFSISALTGCSQKKSEASAAPSVQQSLSAPEKTYVEQQSPDAPVAIIVYHPDTNTIDRETVAASEVLNTQNAVLRDHADAIFALDFPVSAEDIQSDFSGKSEFDLDGWKNEAPLADGRGVKIAIVDDGIALGRAGNEATTTDQAKVAQFFNLNPRWNQRIEKSALPYSFELTACGIVRPNQQVIQKCHDFGKTLGESGKVTAVLKAEGDSLRLTLSTGETLAPLHEGLKNRISIGDGTFWGYDVYKEGEFLLLSIKIPERGLSTRFVNSGSHGDGVAGIAAGHNLGNRPLDGVAPGAQLVDVDFTDATDAGAYTIGSVLEALVYAGKTSDLVNLSYSLFFDSPVAQVSMGRLMEGALKDLNALYFFSAGNNGPGIGSMNRALLYPSFGIPVAAYLSGRLSQTTFGSSEPVPGVAPYSSVGPGIDGGSGSLLLSPLAGMTASTADGGYQAFSGTSSATPALAGFSARLLSRIRQENLPFDKKVFREALVRSAQPLKNVPFIDQGYGIPNLPRAYAAYVSLLAEKTHPTISVLGSQTVHGVRAKGIYVRHPRELLTQYVFSVTVAFPASMSEEDRANASEILQIEKSGDFFSAPDRLLIGRAGTTFQLTMNADKITAPGGYFGEVRVKMVSTGQVITVPVTVLNPDVNFGSQRSVRVPKGGVARLFFEVKRPDASLLLQLVSSGGICGRVGVYNPSGIRSAVGVQTVNFSPKLQEQRHPLAQPGVYELVIEGRQNHRACATDQNFLVRSAIVGGTFSLVNQTASEMIWAMDAEIEGDELARSSYELFLEDPVEVRDVAFNVDPNDRSILRASGIARTEAKQTARLYFREKSAYGKVLRFPYLNAKAISASDSVDLTFDFADGGNVASLGELAEPTDILFTRFEQGLPQEEIQTSFGTTQLWLQRAEEASAKVALGFQDPNASGILRTAIPRTAYREWGCRMRPAGFQTIAASCGRVGR